MYHLVCVAFTLFLCCYSVALKTLQPRVCKINHIKSSSPKVPGIKHGKFISSSALAGAEIPELDDSNDSSELEEEEQQKTHGYEGDFKVGETVKVRKSIRIWSVKEYMEEGFDCKDYVGKVSQLVLYGRKLKTLCSAVTPIKVEFQPDGKNIPEGMFSRKWVGHFAADELERVEESAK